jgi:hypothetical protein
VNKDLASCTRWMSLTRSTDSREQLADALYDASSDLLFFAQESMDNVVELGMALDERALTGFRNDGSDGPQAEAVNKFMSILMKHASDFDDIDMVNGMLQHAIRKGNDAFLRNGSNTTAIVRWRSLGFGWCES